MSTGQEGCGAAGSSFSAAGERRCGRWRAGRRAPRGCRAARTASVRGGVVVDRPELLAVPICLLEVVAQDLVVLGSTLADLCLEPVGEALVEIGARSFFGIAS